MGAFLKELRRRNVFRVAGVYAVVGWLLAQAAVVLETSLGFPGWFDGVVVGFLLIGFPVAMVLAWAFEMTPEGVKLTRNVGEGESIAARTGRRLDYAILIGLVSVAALVIADRIISPPTQSSVAHDAPETGAAASSETAGPATSFTPPAPVDRSKSIAVLPFADFSPGGDQEWFSDGLTEEILNSLARTPDLLVASRTSSFKYKDVDEEIPVIAKRLGVEHVLEGSVRRAGDRLRVTAQLIRASDGFHLWSENYDRTADDVIAIQEEIAIEIAKSLKTAMDPEVLQEMLSAGTRSVEAYEAFLEAAGMTSRGYAVGDFDLLRQGIDAYERARRIDPSFAKAHGLAGNFWVGVVNLANESPDMGVSVEEAHANAMAAFDAAIETAPDDASRQRYRADRAFALMDYRDAARGFEAYLESFPNDVYARDGLARTYIFLGAYEKARDLAKAFEAVIGDDPDQQSAAIINYVWAKDYAAAARLSRKAMETQSSNESLVYQAQRALLWAGDRDGAEKAAARFSVIAGGFASGALPGLRSACARADRAEAEAINDAITVTSDATVAAKWLALKLLGDDDAARDLLRRYDRATAPFPLASFLAYPYFDASDFPNLQAMLDRQNINRPPPAPIPFACPQADEKQASAGAPEKSVAVLPFVALSSGDEDGYFADGLTEEVLNALAALPDLLVTARTSSFFYKGKDVPINEIAARLSVAHVVEGSVRRAGGKVRVTAQLIRAADGFHLWSNTYDASMDDVFKVQTDIAEKVATALDILLDREERALMRAAGVNNPEAYAIYAKGEELFRLAHGSLPQIETLVRANREYDRATAAAPDLWAAGYNSADLYSHVLLQLAGGARLETMPEGVGDDPADALQERLNAAMRHAPTQAARDSIDLTLRVFSDDWTGLADLVRKIYGNPEPCGLDQWAHAVGLAFGAAEEAVQYYTRSVKCNRLDGGDWTMASLAALYAGDAVRSLAIIEEGRDVYEATLREEVAHLRALMANGRMAEARAGLSRLSGSDNLRASMQGELAAAMGDSAGALAARDRLLAEAAKDPDVFDAGLRLSAQAGDRETANALAAEVDARPAGPMLLLGAVYFCRCGAPFDLEATPVLAARLEEAGIAWPPVSPVEWPLKDW